MIRRQERHCQTPGHEPDNMSPRKRNRSCWRSQATQPFCGVFPGVMIMFVMVALFDQLSACPAHVPPSPTHRSPKIQTTTAPTSTESSKTMDDYFRSLVLPKMNQSEDPCDDFYNFACGGFVNNAKTPDGKNSVGSFPGVDTLLQNNLLTVITEKVRDDEMRPFKVAKDLYRQCMDTKNIRDKGLSPLVNVWEALGGWPVLKSESWAGQEPAINHLRKQGFRADHFFSISVGVDLKNASRRIIYVDQATLGLSRDDLIQGMDNSKVAADYEMMVELAIFLGADKERAKRELREVVNFGKALAKIVLPNPTALYNPKSVKDLQAEYPYVEWLEHLNEMFMGTGIGIHENEIIIVRTPDFMKDLGTLLGNTSNRTKANYVMWRVMKQYESFFPKKEEHRSNQCLQIITQRLPMAVEALYIRKFFKEDSKVELLNMVKEINQELRDILKTEKLDSMVVHFDFPDDHKLQEHYFALDYRPSRDYLNNTLYIERFLITKSLKKLRKVVDETDDIPHTSLIRYSFSDNVIHVPALYFEGPFYSFDRPKYMNYGAIGSVIGREITRGFYDQGRRLHEPVRCLNKQYDNYKDSSSNQKENGYITFFEYIADNSGVRAAYNAYQKWAEKNGSARRESDLNLTPQKMFWLSAAQNWCSPEATISNGSAVAAKLRVIGPMSNMAAFSKDYGCSPDARMNPAVKCEAW